MIEELRKVIERMHYPLDVMVWGQMQRFRSQGSKNAPQLLPVI